MSGFRKNPQFKDLFKGLGFMGLGVGLRVRVSGSGFPVSGFRVCFQPTNSSGGSSGSNMTRVPIPTLLGCVIRGFM